MVVTLKAQTAVQNVAVRDWQVVPRRTLATLAGRRMDSGASGHYLPGRQEAILFHGVRRAFPSSVRRRVQSAIACIAVEHSQPAAWKEPKLEAACASTGQCPWGYMGSFLLASQFSCLAYGVTAWQA